MKPRDRGAQAVEFALVLPVLLLLLVGIMEFGRVFNLQAQLTQAARVAARTMALQNNQSAARAAAAASAPSLGITSGRVSISPATCPATGSADVTVRITVPVSFVSGMFGAGLTLTGTGVMRCQG